MLFLRGRGKIRFLMYSVFFFLFQKMFLFLVLFPQTVRTCFINISTIIDPHHVQITSVWAECDVWSEDSIRWMFSGRRDFFQLISGNRSGSLTRRRYFFGQDIRTMCSFKSGISWYVIWAICCQMSGPFAEEDKGRFEEMSAPPVAENQAFFEEMSGTFAALNRVLLTKLQDHLQLTTKKHLVH